MLLELNIENIALIESLRIEFAAGFNVLTGETGAGTSISMAVRVFNTFSGTITPDTRQMFRPLRLSSRRTAIMPSSASMPCSRA